MSRSSHSYQSLSVGPLPFWAVKGLKRGKARDRCEREKNLCLAIYSRLGEGIQRSERAN